MVVRKPSKARRLLNEFLASKSCLAPRPSHQTTTSNSHSGKMTAALLRRSVIRLAPATNPTRVVPYSLTVI